MSLYARECENYYCAQAGSGYFQANPIQRGYGFFGDLRRFITPLALKAGRYLGGKLLQTGKNVTEDVAGGDSFQDSSRKRMLETSEKMKSDFFQKFQRGKGIKRKRKKNTRHSKTKRCKTVNNEIFA